MTTILADLGSEREIIEEQRQAWLYRVLLALGADAQRLEIDPKTHLAELGIEVWDGVDGTIEVIRPEYEQRAVPSDDPERQIDIVSVEVGQKLIAQWNKPTIIRIKENKGSYLQITLNEWALPLHNED